MYADRVEAAQNKSVMDRINGNSSSHTRRITGKRQRQDDKWEHDLYEETEPQLSNRRVGARDLRTKLQKKGLQSASQSQNVPLSAGWDLREKLSGTSTRAVNAAQIKPKVLPESAKQTIKSVAVEASVLDTKKTSNSSRRKTYQKESVDSFLESLGLEKYLITFQAEEVDMAALLHMTDEDLKALGIPMGPRKKILLALESRQ